MTANVNTAVQPAPAPLIECIGLGREYPMGNSTIHALRDVSTQIDQGELVAIMGPSGSGKSTFMNMVGVLDTPTHGSLKFEGREVSTLSDDAHAALRNTSIGFVFQQFMLMARTSAVDNVRLPLMYAGVDRKRQHELAMEALSRVGLADRSDHTPAQLSGGQQQRVAIARALVNHPRMLLADEPTGALDSVTSEEIMDLFKALNAEGMTVVLVTHEEDIAAHARRILRFKDGLLVSDSAAGEPA